MVKPIYSVVYFALYKDNNDVCLKVYLLVCANEVLYTICEFAFIYVCVCVCVCGAP